jgi:nucleotide-binding universal stress UspA family protein
MLTPDQRILPFERIAILTDLGDDIEKTLEYTTALCRWYNSELLLFHATDGNSPDEPKQTLAALLENPAWCDLSSKIIVTKANMSDGLGQLDTYKPDILVLTTRAKHNLQKWVAGSITQEIFRRTHRPVLVLGPAITSRESVTPKPYSGILYATDMSAVSVMALHLAAGIAHDQEAQLTALYVESDSEKGFTADRVIAEQRLRDWMQDHIRGMAHAIEKARITVAFGEPAKHILDTARDQKVDLIVMGAHGMGEIAGLASRFLGGTAYEVCCKSRCPLLIVPEPH